MLVLEIEQERLASEPLDRAPVQLPHRRTLHQNPVFEQQVEAGAAKALDLYAIQLADRMAVNPLQH
jgi:hypothetical protein